MNRSLVGLRLFILIIGIVGIVNCYKWVPLKSGGPLPKNIVRINFYSEAKYVGRAKHFDDILPAEIDEDALARISACGEEIPKDEYEILTSSDDCQWLPENDAWNQVENILHVGTNNWNNEPIYVGTVPNRDSYHVASIHANKGRYDKRLWSGMQRTYYNDEWVILCCNITTKWTASSATELPKNSVYGGKSNEGYDTYVARLRKDCEKIVGQFIPVMGIATAILSKDSTMQAHHFEMLIGDTNEYAWVSGLSKGRIPDYAVYTENGYVARVNETIVSLKRRDALELLNYEILVSN